MNERLPMPWGGLNQGSLTLRHELLIPISTPSNNQIKGMHFHAYKTLRGQWLLMVRSALNGKLTFETIPKSFIVVNRFSSGSGLDWDNAYGGLKPLLDCLVEPSSRNPDGLGLIADDNLKSMPFPPYINQLSAKPRESKTLVQIYELI